MNDEWPFNERLTREEEERATMEANRLRRELVRAHEATVRTEINSPFLEAAIATLRKALGPDPDRCECAPGFEMDGCTFPPLICWWCDARALLARLDEGTRP